MRTLAMPKTAEPWSLTSLREKLIKRDRREGRQPRPLRHIPTGRGRGTATDVQRHSVADRPAAGTTRASMIIAGGQMRQTMTADVRLGTGKAARFRASVQATDRQSPAVRAVRCLPLLKTPPRPYNSREFGECRVIYVSQANSAWPEMSFGRVAQRQTPAVLQSAFIGAMQ